LLILLSEDFLSPLPPD